MAPRPYRTLDQSLLSGIAWLCALAFAAGSLLTVGYIVVLGGQGVLRLVGQDVDLSQRSVNVAALSLAAALALFVVGYFVWIALSERREDRRWQSDSATSDQ